jgi:hypothetical protein
LDGAPTAENGQRQVVAAINVGAEGGKRIDLIT